MNIKTGDMVTVLSGDDKGKTAKVTRAFPALGKVLVEGVNIVKKHERPRQQGAKGQTVERAMPIFVSKVKLAGGIVKEPKTVKVAKPAKK
jgi:large subunit ribosomal protein L24